MRPMTVEENRFRELYRQGNELLFATPSTESQMERWPCFAQLDAMTLYSIREIGINRYFHGMVEEHPDWNVFVVRQPRYFPAILHGLNYVKTVCVQQGTCTLHLDGRDYRLEAGDICFLSPGVVHSVVALSDDALAVNVILRRSIAENCFVSFLSRDDILSSFFAQLFYQPNAAPVIIFRTGAHSKVQKVLSLLEEEAYVVQDRYTIQMTEGYLLELFGLLMRHHSDNVTVIDRTQKLDDENLVACLRYLNGNYVNVTLNELAEQFHYSPSQLSKLIKRCVGCTFLEFVRRKKLEKAAVLLLSGDLPIKDVPEAAGFSDSSHFYRTFRAQYGMTPLEYRRINGGQDNERI